MPNRYRPEDEDAIIFFLNLCGYIEVTQLIGYSFAFFRNLGCIIVLKAVFLSVLYEGEGGGLLNFPQDFVGDRIAQIQRIWAFWKSQILAILKSLTLYKSEIFDDFAVIVYSWRF